MKLGGSVLGAVAMVVGSLGATGCKAGDGMSDSGKGAVAPEETPERAPVSTTVSPAAPEDAQAVHYYGPRPPGVPAEERGRAPSERHFWSPGYQQWNGHEHVWHHGGWYARRDGYEYNAPHWENGYGRWEYLPGRWVRHT